MNNSEYQIFSEVLHIENPFVISNIMLDTPNKEVHIYVGFTENPTFTFPECGEETCWIHDFREKIWRHMNLFEYRCYVYCLTHRIFSSKCKKTRDIKIPWSRKGSGFSLLMDGLILSLSKVIPVATIGDFLGETDSRLSRVINFYVSAACRKKDLSHVQNIGIDETSLAKGHKYITIVTDLDNSEVIFGGFLKPNFFTPNLSENMI